MESQGELSRTLDPTWHNARLRHAWIILRRAELARQGAATREIARNVQEAAHGTQMVTASVCEVQKRAEETGSSSQVLSAAQSLAAESVQLERQVSRFLATVRAA